ncbi:response regulator transcription factor [Stenotrophomonas sp. SAU14A_NAIMI4_8]|uniref:response regulator transcription factor n=1 Tax=Stenotrophomonas sp. SAU14A_NAIMI4_8 TaxID=2072409 RepID=UPI00131F1A08|nr:response regulator transcription factor [Stenotrophomonas sp. SAU14A_NAIMI4_8]
MIIADDHPVVRAGAREIINRDVTAIVVGEAATPEEMIGMLGREQCDVLVTDLTMPGQQPDGLAMLDAVHRKYPSVGIVLLTVSANSRLLQLVVASGARCIVNKNAGMDELSHAINAAARGKSYIGQSLKSVLAASPAGKRVKGVSQLSPREIDVLRQIAAHRTVGEIAVQQMRSVATISHQKISGMRKLGLKTDAELHVFLSNGELTL